MARSSRPMCVFDNGMEDSRAQAASLKGATEGSKPQGEAERRCQTPTKKITLNSRQGRIWVTGTTEGLGRGLT